MPRFWTRLVDSLPRESKNLAWRVPLVAVVIVLSACIFFPFRDAPYAEMVVLETYDEYGHPDLDERQVESRSVTSRWVWLTNFFHYKVERDLTGPEDVETGDARTVRRRHIQVISRGLNLGLDLRGGSELLYKIKLGEKAKETATAEEIKGVVQKRIDASGLREPRIQVQGSDRLLVQLPGQEKGALERVKKVIENIGHLEFRLAADPGSPPDVEWKGSGEAPEGYTAYNIRSLKKGKGKETTDRILISDRAEMTGEYIANTYVNVAGTGESLKPTVILGFTPVGEQKFGTLTGDNVDKRLAIVLNTHRVDGQILAKDKKDDSEKSGKGICYSAPVIRSAIFGNASIEGDFDVFEARNLRTVLMAGSLPAPLELEHENTVGPSLGPALISKGVRAIAIGLILVLVFMSSYYWLAGVIANFALFLNILIIVSVMILFDATLTLPGIAGLLLTVGMSVDANVLIFERIREERHGPTDKPLRLAIRDGYDKAFWTIFDANVTTLFTGVILYWRGTGAIKGFAVVLCVGILASMFTALVCTRVVFNILTWRRWIKRLPMLQLIRNPHVPFMSLRKKAFVASAVVIAGGMTVFVLRGNDNWDIDFKGGQLIHLVFSEPIDADEIHDRLRKANPQFADCEVQPLAAAATEEAGPTFVRGRTAREFAVRFPYLSEVTVPPITAVAGPSEGPVDAVLTLHAAAAADALAAELEAAKVDYSVTPSGEADADGKYTEFVVRTTETDLKAVRAALDGALKNLEKPEGDDSAIDRLDRIRYRSRVEGVAIDRPVPAAEIQAELEQRGGHWRVVPEGEGTGDGRYRAFTIESDVASIREARERIERAFATQTLTAEVAGVFSKELVPRGVETIDRNDGRVKVEVNLTVPVPLGTIEERLGQWNVTEAKPVPEVDTEKGVSRFTLEVPAGKVNELERRLTEEKQTFSLSDPIPRVAKVGPAVARQMLIWAVVAIAAASIGIIAYVWLRFERFKYGVAAVAALIHDVLITMGLLAIFGRSFNLPIVAALLTIIGYSINDTIVVFDRIRENLRKARKRDVDAEIVDASINQVLSRTVLTSITTLLAVLSLFLFAGGVIQDFALALLIGVFVGTYSSVFIASPLLILHQEKIEKRRR